MALSVLFLSFFLSLDVMIDWAPFIRPGPGTSLFGDATVLIFILVLVTHVHTTDIQCMQTLSMYITVLNLVLAY